MALLADPEVAVVPDLGGLTADILDRIQDGFYAIGRDWRFVYANRAACEMWGTPRDTVLGRVLWDRFPQLRGSKIGRLLRRAVNSGAGSEFEAFCAVARRRLRFRVDPIRSGITGVFLREIADRQPDEQAQQANEERLQIASEAARLGYWERDLTTGELRPSAICKANFGLPPEAPLSYEMVVAAIDPDHRESVCEALRRAVSERTDYEAEYPISWPDGSRHWISVRGRCLYAADGRPLRNVGITIDITAHKQSDEALREREEHLMLAQAGAGVGIWDWNLATGQIYWSPQMFRLLGLDPLRDAADLHGAWLRVVHPDDRARVRAASHRRRFNPGPSEFDYRIIGPDGGIRWILAKGMAVTLAEGRPVRVAGINIDITERKAAEAKLQELTEGLEARVRERTRELVEVNDRLRRERLLSELIIENATEGIIVVDTEMRHLVWSAGMESINGLPRSEVLGKTVFEVYPGFADHPVGRAWREALAGRRAEMRDFRFFSHARGAEVVYDADFTPLYDQTGAIIGAVCMLREMTERRRMEHMLRQSQKMEAVAQLTGGVAHDFNNLLTAVVGCLEMILLEAKNERIASLVRTALRSANRGARLTQQLLAFARRQALRPVLANLNTLLTEIEELLRRAVGERIGLILECSPDLSPCEVDPAQFEAAVMNLVINARDAMPKGGCLTLKTTDIQARDVPAYLDLAPGDYVAFSIHDTGDGMTPEVMSRAFEPFYTTKEIGKGSGLGLSMVYGFAKQSGGGVHLESAPGLGTCVTLYLPRASPPSEISNEAGLTDELGRRSGSILVVEDDEDVREVSIAMLEELGCRVCVARDAQEALIAVRRPDRIDLLFTDLAMPGGMSGLALAREAQLIRPGLKVLLTTGYAGLEGAGAEEFPIIRKPFRPAELGRIVADLLESNKPN